MKLIGRLCIITDTNLQRKFTHIELASMAVKGGADMIQFRDKEMSTGGMIQIAADLSRICKRNNIIFIVNDRVDVAIMVDADGVHLGNEDLSVKDARKLLGKSKIIGRTAHSVEEALQAQHSGADYMGFGHIFTTASKLKLTSPKGIAELHKVCKGVRIPVLAIGGINQSNIKTVIQAGAHGVAVLGAVAKSQNPYETVKKLCTSVSLC